MSEKRVDQDWDDLCERVKCGAGVSDSQQRREQAERFINQSPPHTYQELLDRVSEAAPLTTGAATDDPSSENASAERTAAAFDPQHGIIDAIDEAGMESFPASDPSAHY